MKTISDTKYKEYLDLKRWAKREKVYQSMKCVSSLEDDIDLPIKKCVAMFALWGFEPLFSCCGFDYAGQPFHKSHQYGRPYFMFKYNELSKSLTDCRFPNNWKVYPAHKNTVVFLEQIVHGNPHWRRKECIHFSEEINIGISWIERWLLSNLKLFKDSIILYDTNQNYKKSGIRYWQYETKSPWLVEKLKIDSY